MSKLNIVILDDDSVQRYAIKRQLINSKLKFNIFETETGEDALAVLQSKQIHCIIVDYILPEYTGLDFIDRVNELYGHCPPFLFITSFGTGEVVRRAFKSGCLDYIAKDKINSEQLLKAVIMLAESSTSQNEIINKIENIEMMATEFAHDLNSPLRSMNYSISQILTHCNTDINPEVLSHINNIKSNIINVGNMLIDINHGVSNKNIEFNFKIVDLNHVAHNVIESITRAYPDKTINFTLTPLPLLRGDQSSLFRILYNIISNGIKYNNKDIIDIKIYYNQTTIYNEIIIQDNGIGMTNSNIRKIFKPFYRTKVYEEAIGTGLGLAICRRLIDQHNGKIFVESAVDTGSSFKIALPRSHA